MGLFFKPIEPNVHIRYLGHTLYNYSSVLIDKARPQDFAESIKTFRTNNRHGS